MVVSLLSSITINKSSSFNKKWFKHDAQLNFPVKENISQLAISLVFTAKLWSCYPDARQAEAINATSLASCELGVSKFSCFLIYSNNFSIVFFKCHFINVFSKVPTIIVKYFYWVVSQFYLLIKWVLYSCAQLSI